MIRKGTPVVVALLVVALGAPGGAAAGAYPPCGAAAGAGLAVADAAGAGALYATHELSVSALPKGEDTSIDVRSAAAPGARRLDEGDPEQSDPVGFVRDTPGPLTISANVYTDDPSRPQGDQSCVASVSRTVELRAALPPLISIKRPRRGRAGNGDLIYPYPPIFRISLKQRAGGNRMPVTVRARATRRLKLPSKRAKAATAVFAQRGSDAVQLRRGCLLICSPETSRGFSTATSVRAFPSESERLFSRGLRVELVPPVGYPGPFRRGKPERFIRTPFGADVELLQAGRRIARLRVVALCSGGGQSSRCHWRTISTKP